MATYTIINPTNIDSLASKTGGDIYNVSGGTLTIDQDSRAGLNQSTSSTLGNMSVSATLGGLINIDSTAIWMIPYTGGSGNVPAWNTIISNGTGSGKLIAVHASLTSASTATGSAMPTTGFLRVKQKTGAYVAGALTGISATASDTGRIGWLEIVGNEGSTITANRLGAVNITGSWYEVGTTSGVSNQTIQIPNNGLERYIAGVYIEKTAGSEDYEFYPNAGTATTTGTEAERGKVVWVDNAGLLRIGNSGSATNGYTPIAGLKIVVGNIFFENCTTTARTANVIPNASVATRYDFTTTGGGVVNIDKCNMAWYLSCLQAYSVSLSNSGFVDTMTISEVATYMTFTKVGVGNKPITALLVSPLNMTLCFAGGTFTDCVWQRVSMAASAAHNLYIYDSSGFDIIRNTIRCGTIRGHATTYAIQGVRLESFNWIDTTVIQGPMSFTTCNKMVVLNTNYIEAVSGTSSTLAGYVWQLSSNTTNCIFSGLNFPIANNHPYTALLTMNTRCSGNKFRNVGTRTNPLDMGTLLACGYVYTMFTACFNNKFQRIYVKNTRTGSMSGDNSSKDLLEENVYGDYANGNDIMAVLNYQKRGSGAIGALTAQTSVYGTHFKDSFTAETAGRVTIMMNETTVETASQVTLANGARFTSAGGLVMPTIGDSVLFEIPYYMLGHTGFANSPLIMAGGTATSYGYKFQIDKNDGAGWSAESATFTPTTLGTALNAITGINASLGFKIRLRITTITTNTLSITSVYMVTTSTATAQDYQYPLDTYNLTLSGIVAGSDVTILLSETETVRESTENIVGTTYNYVYSAQESVDIRVYKPGYYPFSIVNYSLSSSNASLPVVQTQDESYLD